MNTAALLWGVLFGSIGMGLFLYGKREAAVVPLVCGVGLMVFTFFVTNTFALVGIGLLLSILPYFLRI